MACENDPASLMTEESLPETYSVYPPAFATDADGNLFSHMMFENGSVCIKIDKHEEDTSCVENVFGEIMNEYGKRKREEDFGRLLAKRLCARYCPKLELKPPSMKWPSFPKSPSECYIKDIPSWKSMSSEMQESIGSCMAAYFSAFMGNVWEFCSFVITPIKESYAIIIMKHNDRMFQNHVSLIITWLIRASMDMSLDHAVRLGRGLGCYWRQMSTSQLDMFGVCMNMVKMCASIEKSAAKARHELSKTSPPTIILSTIVFMSHDVKHMFSCFFGSPVKIIMPSTAFFEDEITLVVVTPYGGVQETYPVSTVMKQQIMFLISN